MSKIINIGQKLSFAEKERNDKAWYKSQMDMLDTQNSTGGFDSYRSRKVNYDLFNNILNLDDFEHVCKPYGAEVGELPADMVNRDISSPKIKAILGMEMQAPLNYTVVAINPEATTRKEQEETKRMREFVVNTIMLPIRQQIEQQYAESQKGKELSDTEKQDIQKQVAQDIETQTPEEVRKYMLRDHQDPVEIMSGHLLEYLMRKNKLAYKFNLALKHGLLSAVEVMYVGNMNGEPVVWNVNSLRLDCEMSPDSALVHEGEWVTCEYRMTASDIVKLFSKELTDTEINQLYEDHQHYKESRIRESMFTFTDNEDFSGDTIRVLHCVWKSLRKIGFLTYLDQEGQEQQMIVDEAYKFNMGAGDVDLVWEWIVEVYEGWKIGSDIYKRMRPLPGQFKDLDNIYEAKLPYYGVIYDNLNSQETSLMDRLKVYQYYYNIVMFRLELMLASDKGKKVLMNINAIPDSSGIDMAKWKYFFETTPFMWIDPNEEGVDYKDINTLAKEIDLSLISDIAKYIDLAEYLRVQAGKSVGIPEEIEGQIGGNQAVANVRQTLVQTSHILKPYFELHNLVKEEVLNAMIESAKIAYRGSGKKKLSYILDDMGVAYFDLDSEMLDNSTLGIFVENSAKAYDTRQLIQNLAQAALHSNKVEFSDVISVIEQDSVAEAKESLLTAEGKRKTFEQHVKEQEQKFLAEQAEKQRQEAKEQHAREKELIILKETERRKTEVAKTALMGASFNPDQDKDNDGVNDFVEIAQQAFERNVELSKQQLSREQFEHQKKVDKEKLANDKLKAKKAVSKSQ